jgi:uncharacterized protein Yka (UPF0111/DUF47 family)
MFSFQKLIGKGEEFYDLLEASAEQANKSVEALIRLLNSGDSAATMDEFVQARRMDKKITTQISERLCKTFITPLEREDLEALSNSLYKIPKTIEKFGTRLILSRQRVGNISFNKQAELLHHSTQTVLEMVRSLRKQPKLLQIQKLNEQLQHYEGEADKLINELYKDLYSGKFDPIQVIILKDLYELLEKVVDKCRDAGNILFHIVLKNS